MSIEAALTFVNVQQKVVKKYVIIVYRSRLRSRTREGSPKSSLLTEAGNMGLVRPRSADKSARRGLWGDLDNISSQPALLQCSGECDAAMVGSVVKYAF